MTAFGKLKMVKYEIRKYKMKNDNIWPKKKHDKIL